MSSHIKTALCIVVLFYSISALPLNKADETVEKSMDGASFMDHTATNAHAFRGSTNVNQPHDHDHESIDFDSHADMSPMYFHMDSRATFFFKSWTTTTPLGIITGCLATFVLCFVATFLTHHKRIYLLKNKANYLDAENFGNSPDVRVHLSLIFAFQTIVAGLIMLLYMTYNGWVFISIVTGLTAGYFISESRHDNHAASPNSAHC